MRYWPFLTGRVRRTGHRVVAAPEVMTAAQADELLGLLPAPGGGFASDGGDVLRRIVGRSPVGPVTIFYRVADATAERYAVAGEGALRDQHGRSILVTEGIVVRGAHPGPPRPEIPAALRQAHAVVAPVFREFWDTDEEFVPARMPLLDLPSPDKGNQVAFRIIDMEGPILAPNQRTLRKRMLVAAVATVVGLGVAAAGWQLWPHGCGGAFSGMHLNDQVNGECIGVSDGGYLFNKPATSTSAADRQVMEKINQVQLEIQKENSDVARGAGRYVKVALLTPLTVSKRNPSAMSLNQIQYSLEGSYAALHRVNQSSDFGDPSAVRLQLLLANQGSQQEAGDDLVDDILKLSETDHPLVAVVGLGSSVPNTRTVAEKLAAKEIPMVSAVASADSLTDLKWLWSVSPSNANYAQALRSLLDHQDAKKPALTSGIVVFDENADLYTTSLKHAYETQFAGYLNYPPQPFRGSTIESAAAPNAFSPVVANLCSAASNRDKPLDMVFYAGRVADFRAFAKTLENRVCNGRPLAVLVGATGFAAAQEYTDVLDHGKVTVIYATSSDASAWGNGAAGAPADYPAFENAYRDRGFDPANLVDGYAIAHHDAFAAAAKAIRLATQSRTVPRSQDVASQFGRLNLANEVRAACGRLSFPAAGGRAAGRVIPIRQIGTGTSIKLSADLKPYVV